MGVDATGSGSKLSILCYADDIVLLAESRKGLQQLLDTMHAYLRRWRLEVNMEKTKVVIFGDPGKWKYRHQMWK